MSTSQNPETKKFYKQLLRFHANRGTDLTKMPVLGRKEVDLFELYERVKAVLAFCCFFFF
jgi:hypothetical protein